MTRPSLRRVGVAISFASILAAPVRIEAQEPIQSLVGRRIGAVRVVTAAGAAGDPAAVRAVTLVVGEPLRVETVRETLRHIALIDRFDTARVEAVRDGDDVSLMVVVTPRPRVDRFEVTGETGLSGRRLRRAAEERLGPLERSRRFDDIARTMRETLVQAGFRAALVTPRIEARSERSATLRMHVDAGTRSRISSVRIAGVADEASWRKRLGVEAGAVWDEAAVRRRLEREVERLRERGHYEVEADIAAPDDGDPSHVAVTVSIVPGPVVKWRVEGDIANREALEALVPIAREGTADEDLLEDAARIIETALRDRGYPSATVRHRRDAAPGLVTVVFEVTAGTPAVVGNVTVAGASSVAEQTLLGLTDLRAGSPFVETRLDAAARAMRALLDVRGHASGRVAVASTPRGPLAGAARVVDVRFDVVEGPRTTIGSVTLEGTSAVADADVRAVMRTTVGAPYVAASVVADRAAIQRLYAGRGFPDAQVTITPAFDAAQTSVALTFAIVEGALVTVDHLLIVGNERIASSIIAHEVVLEPGRPLSPDAIAESQRRLSALGLFRRVRVDDVPEPGATARDVVVAVEEADATTFGYGVGLEGGQRLRTIGATVDDSERFEFAPRGFVELGRRNLWGKNRSVNLFGRASLKQRDDTVQGVSSFGINEYRALATYREPRAFGLDGTFAVTTFVEQAIRSSFNFRRRGVNAEFTQRVASRLTWIGRYTLGDTSIFDDQIAEEDRPLIDRLFPQVHLSTVSTALILDTRNDAFDPVRGVLISSDLDVASERIGSEVGYVKTLTQAFAYRRLPGRSGIVVAGGVRVGFAAGFERAIQRVDESGDVLLDPDGQPIVDLVKNLPASERFFAGGDTTVRGYALDRLGDEGTLDSRGFPSGGNALMILNAEVRVPLTNVFGVVVFVDAGNVWASAAEFDVSGLKPTAGFGLRYKSPVGPIRFDIGFKLRPGIFDTRRFSPHFSIGQAF